MTSGPTTLRGCPPGVRRAIAATGVAFSGSGFAFASWASRIPQVKYRLHLDPSELGLLLFAIAAGSLVALPLAGTVVSRFGSERVVRYMAVLFGVALAVVAAGYQIGVAPVAVGLFLLGLANGAWDVAMNVQAALIERRLGRSIMPRFHAGWSFGTVAGALVGAGMVVLHVPVTIHLAAVALALVVVVPLSVRAFLEDQASSPVSAPVPEREGSARTLRRRRALAHWREGRTVLIGIFVLAFAFAEGTGNDWISVAVIGSYHTSVAIGTLAYATFLAAMTTGRWMGPVVLERYGRVRTLRTVAGLGVLGIALFVLGPFAAVAFLGVVCWGLGTALGFPVGMSAGADDPAFAAGRVSVVASIGYCAFLAGPPTIGFLGDHLTVHHALAMVALLLGIAVLLAGALRPLRPRAETGQAARDALSAPR